MLVLGATGSTGRRVTDLLRARGHPVRAASRTGEVRFDWAAPDTWEPAVAGASGLYLMAPDGVPVDPEFVRCAVSHGVTRIVLLSSGGIEVMGDERLMAAERTVRASDVDWTILRPDWFDQNFDVGFLREPILAGQVALPVGDARQAFVDAGDIAAVAVAALTERGHAGQSYEISGPRALSFGEAVALISAEAGRPIRFLGDPEAYLAERLAAGASADEAAQEVEAFAALRAQGDREPADTVRRVTGREAKDFAEYVAEAAEGGAWRN